MDGLQQNGFISDWNFVDGSINQVQITLNALVLQVPTFAAPHLAKPPASGYWAYVSCFITGLAGADMKEPVVPGVSIWAIVQGLVTGAAWGPNVVLVGGIMLSVDTFNKGDKVARDCAKATGYTPWILDKNP